MLQAPKNSHSDLNNISSVCYKLNSMQLRMLLGNYRPAPDELDIPRWVLFSSCNFSVKKKKTCKEGVVMVGIEENGILISRRGLP